MTLARATKTITAVDVMIKTSAAKTTTIANKNIVLN